MWLSHLALRDVRNIGELAIELSPGLNVFVGRNAQGKTSVLEAVGLLARGRSFRTENARAMIRRGKSALLASGQAREGGREVSLEVELTQNGRTLRVDGREVAGPEYAGRLEVAVYSLERLRAVRGSMRERRQFLDRSAGALWPAYRQALREFERVLAQRNAALAQGARDLAAWDEGFCRIGAALRVRRARYARRLSAALARGFRPDGERYTVRVGPDGAELQPAEAERALRAELSDRHAEERRLRCSLAGPHRDPVEMTVDGEELADSSAGQARCLLLAVTLAALDVYSAETGSAGVALLDDLDSELDAERAELLCREVAARGQGLITSAHPAWGASCRPRGRLFSVEAGRAREADGV